MKNILFIISVYTVLWLTVNITETATLEVFCLKLLCLLLLVVFIVWCLKRCDITIEFGGDE